jgi:signal transduction histidine kinase
VVATADGERRVLERDLHDGAQQRLLALAYEVRMARAHAEAQDDHDRAAALAVALDEASAAIAELRAIAHSLHPAILSGAGLGPALGSLADAAAVPVEILDCPAERYPEAVERAAYHAVGRAIQDAEQVQCPNLTVRLSRDGDRLILDLRPAGDLAREDAVVDRIGALGGEVRIGDGGVRLVVPCA